MGLEEYLERSAAEAGVLHRDRTLPRLGLLLALARQDAQEQWLAGLQHPQRVQVDRRLRAGAAHESLDDAVGPDQSGVAGTHTRGPFGPDDGGRHKRLARLDECVSTASKVPPNHGGTSIAKAVVRPNESISPQFAGPGRMFEGGRKCRGCSPVARKVTRLALSTVLIVGAMAVLSAAPAAAAPTASFTVSPGTTVLVGTTVTFNSTSQPDPDPAAGPITGFAWTFGEGAGASTDTATHTFNTPGTFPVTLTVTDSLGTASASTTITVNPRPPTVSFTATPRVALINQPITFNPTAVAGTGAITGATWNFGNGTLPVPGAPVPVTRSYSATGNHTVRLTITDSLGLTATTTRPIRIHTPPTAAFDAFPNDPTVGQEVILSSYSSDDRAVESQNWDLDGDGAFDDASGQRVLGTFTTPGPHTVALRVRDDDGATATASQILNIKSSELAHTDHARRRREEELTAAGQHHRRALREDARPLPGRPARRVAQGDRRAHRDPRRAGPCGIEGPRQVPRQEVSGEGSTEADLEDEAKARPAPQLRAVLPGGLRHRGVRPPN